jgi:hypothetical protein
MGAILATTGTAHASRCPNPPIGGSQVSGPSTVMPCGEGKSEADTECQPVGE